MNDKAPIVSVFCLAFNQEKYIKETLDGFVMQKTDFPFEVLINDDASTDRTTEIIREYQNKYPDTIHAIYKSENQYSLGKMEEAVSSLFLLGKGKYMAICEGDDFWTDPLKLQKQVDFMEKHPDVSISCHKVMFKYEENKTLNHIFPEFSGNYIYDKEEFMGKYIAATCSLMWKNENIDKLGQFFMKVGWGDVFLFYFFANNGNVGYLDELMATYRLHGESMYFPIANNEKDRDAFKAFLEIKWHLKIWGSKRLNKKIINLGLKVLENEHKENNLNVMRKTLFKCLFAILSVDKTQLKQLTKYFIIAFVPGAPLFLQDRS